MDFKQLIKDLFRGNTSALKYRFKKLFSLLRRKWYYASRPILPSAGDLPVIINNRNRYTYLLELCSWLEKNGFYDITILDNGSDYPPLIEWYLEDCPYTVIHMNQNVGPRALWIYPGLKKLMKGFYIYTDADVVPDPYCKKEHVKDMINQLSLNPSLEKIGFALNIDTIPDHFKLKDEVIKWESQFWQKKNGQGYYVAPVDTTFAVYAPYARGGGECKAWRTDRPVIAHHKPWYENSANPGEESEYYTEHAAPLSSHWTELTRK
jgi:hypothetical protein